MRSSTAAPGELWPAALTGFSLLDKFAGASEDLCMLNVN